MTCVNEKPFVSFLVLSCSVFKEFIELLTLC